MMLYKRAWTTKSFDKIEEITMRQIENLNNPIDVQFLMHEAYRKVSWQIEEVARNLQMGGDIGPFNESFDLWGKHLMYHAQNEDQYMTGPFKESQAARDNEMEHVVLANSAKDFAQFLKSGDQAAIEASLAWLFAFEEHQHRELVYSMTEVMDLLKSEVDKNAILSRTRRHIYSKTVALRVTEFDHFDNEETFVFPVVHAHMTEEEQLHVARHLLFDDSSKDRRWVFDWMLGMIEPKHRQMMEELERRIEKLPDMCHAATN
jgi:hypothetical protein